MESSEGASASMPDGFYFRVFALAVQGSHLIPSLAYIGASLHVQLIYDCHSRSLPLADTLENDL